MLVLKAMCASIGIILSKFGIHTVKKKFPRGVRFEGCYSPGSVMATHKGVELTSWGCWQAVRSNPQQGWGVRSF